jgi:hypothetical protein
MGLSLTDIVSGQESPKPGDEDILATIVIHKMKKSDKNGNHEVRIHLPNDVLPIQECKQLFNIAIQMIDAETKRQDAMKIADPKVIEQLKRQK